MIITVYVCNFNVMYLLHICLLHATVPPMSAPTITGTTPLSNTSFTVNWTISSTNYDIIVILTNLRTGENTRIAVPDSAENSYTVMTGLNGIDNYNVSLTANSSCGMMMSDPITVYGKNVQCMYIRTYIRTS